MKNNRKLLGSSLIAAIILSVLAFPSLGVKNHAASARFQDPLPVLGQLVQGQTKDEELSKIFRKYDLIKMDPEALEAQIRGKGRLLLRSSVRDFNMQITPIDLRAADYSAQVIDGNGVVHQLPKTAVNTFRGEIEGMPDAQFRMALTERGIEGAIITKDQRFFLQPAKTVSKTAGADEFVFYKSSDLTAEGASCGVTLAEEVAEEVAQPKVDAPVIEPDFQQLVGPVESSSPLRIARISTDADGEYVAALGGAAQANAQIVNILNIVDAIYQVEVGLTFQIVQQNTWANQSTDPYTSSDADTLLDQFKDHWEANFPNPNGSERALAHLFTGKNIDGSTVGIASFPAACRIPNSAYGLSQRFPFQAGSPLTSMTVALTAHEIGHNFGAVHTNQPGPDLPPDIESTCEETIMEASINSGGSFCPFSRSQITGHVTAFAAGCLADSAAPPLSFPDCVQTPIVANGGALNGNLTSGDCRSPSRGVRFFADLYTFNGVAGQRVSATLTRTSGNFFPQLYLIGPDGYFVQQVGINGSTSINSDVITLPSTGTYVLEATSFSEQQIGGYSIALEGINANCRLIASPTNFHFPAGGGTGVVGVTSVGCGGLYNVLPAPSGATWIVPEVTSASGTRAISFTVQPNSSSAGRRGFLVIGQASTNAAGGLRIAITQAGLGPNCATAPIEYGQTITGELTNGVDCHSPARGNNFFADRYTFNAGAGQKIVIQATTPNGLNPDLLLILIGPNGVIQMVDDDSGGGTRNARLPGGTNFLTLGLPGTYTFEVSGLGANQVGPYSVTLTTDGAGNSLHFSQSNFSVGEAAGVVNVPVTRTGDISAPATVEYTTDDNFAGNCNSANGNASAKCDYNTAGGILRFAAGEQTRNIPLSIVNDGFVEGNENLTITLRNASGATFIAPTKATVTIIDNDNQTTNPFDNNVFFVRQQYLDFLLREPDAGGFNSWLTVLNNCQPNQGGLGSNPACDRVHVSSGFFRSTEFGERGYWIYRFYHGVLGRRPQFAEFLPDMRRLSGSLSPADEEAARNAYVNDFMGREDFVRIYGNLMSSPGSAPEFIAKLEQTAGVTLPETVPPTQPGQPPQFGRTELIQRIQNGQFSYPQALRAFIEQKVVFDRFFFRAFVAMQYFGYLLRDPEDAGYNDWVDVLTNGRGAIPPGDFRHLIFGFVWSVEYRQRFGP